MLITIIGFKMLTIKNVQQLGAEYFIQCTYARAFRLLAVRGWCIIIGAHTQQRTQTRAA